MEGAAIFPWPGVEPQSRQQGIIAKHTSTGTNTSASASASTNVEIVKMKKVDLFLETLFVRPWSTSRSTWTDENTKNTAVRSVHRCCFSTLFHTFSHSIQCFELFPGVPRVPWGQFPEGSESFSEGQRELRRSLES